MIWYREIEVPSSKNFFVKKELLDEFKKFCKEEFIIEKAILEGDAWIDYEKMYKYYNSIYIEVYEQNKNLSTKPIKDVFEENLELLRSKYMYQELQKNNPQKNTEDLEDEDEGYKLQVLIT